MTLILSGTDGLSDVDGSAATPAIRGTDANTGIFFPAADTIAFSEGGVESMRIDSSGNVGIGTNSPDGKLHVSDASTGTTLRVVNTSSSSGSRALIRLVSATSTFGSALFQTNGTDASYTTSALNLYAFDSQPLVFGTSNTERMRIDSSGNVGFGGAPTYQLQLGATSTSFPFASPKMYINNSGYNGIGLVNVGNGFLCFVTQPAANHSYFAAYYLNSSQTNIGSINVGTSGVSFNTTSDYRLKENIAPMTGALEKVAALKPVTYTWKESGEATQGFIAHELQAVVPDCVTGEKDAVDDEGRPKYQGIDTSFLVATLTAAIQEMKAIIDTQASTITALQADVEALKGTA
jgi:hypothetical protein